MKIYPFNPSLPDASRIDDHKAFFSSVKEHYHQYQDEGYFRIALESQLLIYDVEIGDKVHTGIICALDSDEITQGNIVRHEMTLKEKEMMMMRLIQDRNANIKPILLTIPNSEKISKWIDSNRNNNVLTYNYGASETHKITPVTNSSALGKITDIFKKEVSKAYIADGHHRCFCIKYLTDKNPEKYGKVLVVFFPFSDLEIKPYNRIIEFDKKMSISQIADVMKPFAKVELVKKFKQSTSRKTFYAYTQGKWLQCTWKKALLKRIDGGSLDLFNHHILNDGLYKTQKKVHYVQGDTAHKSVISTVDKMKSGVGFFFAPLTYDRLISILDRGHLVVPKSTYFEPRMRNGIAVQTL